MPGSSPEVIPGSLQTRHPKRREFLASSTAPDADEKDKGLFIIESATGIAGQRITQRLYDALFFAEIRDPIRRRRPGSYKCNYSGCCGNPFHNARVDRRSGDASTLSITEFRRKGIQ
jgi:hypothetical protein